MDSGIKYDASHFRQVTSEIFMTRYATRVQIVNWRTGT
jgi:hypothetical protein